ncbi:3-hydroxyacyl-CoA dehydrogenase NAD-binding domain-containing protein [Coralliovum pocilloporae]|uniref:3-hydroxyacyl-CoA dehydrogenase NAD-binding domain-containing protein n=1 Tax=Coralliovum pocilloporae TaxID=3066369 RepID=UPI00330788B7
MAEHSPVSILVDGPLAIIRVDNPPVNALSQTVRQGLQDAVHQVEQDATVKGCVLICAGRTFIAGADIREFGKGPLEPPLPDVINAIEQSNKPWLAAIHGTALGGGFELALGCHYRVMSADAEIGLPEVALGIIPGAGGTQRLPRLTGVAKAVELVTSGRRITASEAENLGICDLVAVDGLEEAAKAFLTERLKGDRAHAKTSERPVEGLSDEDAATALAAIGKKARGQVSPVKAAESVLNSQAMTFPDGLSAERAIFMELVQSDQAKALRHAFFGQRAAGKVSEIEGISPRPVSSVAVIGAGTMGAGITVAFERAGFAVTLIEQTAEALSAGVERVSGLYRALIVRGKITEEDAGDALASILRSTSLDAASEADLIVEAVFEDMAVKSDLFRRLDGVAKPGAILATNTSYLDLNALSAETARPQDCLGLHFFSPAHVMKLLEVIRGAETAPDVLAAGLGIAKRLGKTGVVAGVCDGFIGNRIWSTCRKQLECLLEDHVMPEDVDAAMTRFGFPMGPFAVYDLSGLDIAWAQRKRLAASRNPQERYVSIPDRLCEAGRLGQKAGRGYYRYEAGDRRPQTDPDVLAIIVEEREAQGISPEPLEAGEIQQRVRAVMVNEGARILEEGIATRPVEIDMVMIHGYGYPAWRGGPMHEADQIGLDRILEDVKAVCRTGGFGWQPSELLVELVRSGRSFENLNS